MVTALLKLWLKLCWRRLGLLLLANLLWLGLSLLIVTWPAATVGLFFLMQRISEEELEADPRSATIHDFWQGFRTHWKVGSLVAVGDLLCAVVLVVALLFYGQSPNDILRWLVGPIALIGLAWAGAQMYLFPLLIRRAGSRPMAIAREAFLVAISYPAMSVSLLLVVTLLAAVGVVLAGPVLLILFSFVALLQSLGLRSIMVQRGEVVARLTPEQRDERERRRVV